MATIIGAPLDRVDGRLKVTGQAVYAGEEKIPGLAHAVLVQSTIAKGRIAAIDSSAAERAPGVILVLTNRNAPKLASDKPSAMHPGDAYPLLQDATIQYNGQHIAVVVAESFEQASYAATLLRVRYDEERGPVRLEQALDRAQVPQHFRGGERPPDSSRGNPADDFAGAAVKLDETYTTPVEHHNPMEPHAVVAAWQDDTLLLQHSTQAVFGSRDTVAKRLGLPQDKVHVVNRYVGGGFGTKGTPWPHVTLAAMAARMVKRPVKLVLTRRQMFTSNGLRSKTIQRVRLGAQHDGRLVAVLHDGIVRTATFGEFDEPVGLATEIMYSSPSLAVTHRVAAINGGMPTFMRAPGEASGMFALESAMDELAYAVGLNPLELRLRNYAERDEHADLPWSSKSLRQCYEQGAERFGWKRRDARPGAMRDGDTLVGWGMASATYPANRSPASATVRVLADGSATVASGTQDIGTGMYTIMTQVAADGLGLAPARVTAMLGDSRLPKAPVSGGSQSSASVMPAVQAAARSARSELIRLARGIDGGPFAGAHGDDLDIVDGVIFGRRDPSRRLPVAEAMSALGRDAIEATEQSKPGDESKEYSMHSFGAQFVEVQVDAALGTVRIARYVGAFAAGRALNQKTARSQMYGGIVMGIGMALGEETQVDARTGRVVNASLADYLVPVHADVPEIDVLLIDEHDPYVNPLGIKGMGELPIVGTAAAIANAVYHATGRRVRDLPLRLETVMA